MSGRARPPMRRGQRTVETEFGGRPYAVSWGANPAGDPCELFVAARKTASDAEAIARDASIILSIALQRGATFEELRSAVSRGEAETPQSIVGHALDVVAEDVAAAQAEQGA